MCENSNRHKIVLLPTMKFLAASLACLLTGAAASGSYRSEIKVCVFLNLKSVF